jgi:hypothetical protein
MTEYTVDMLEKMKGIIEALNKEQQLHILKILSTSPTVRLNENKSGVFINLLTVSSETLNDIQSYLNYLRDQENTIMELESKKREYREVFFRKDDEAAVSPSY